MHYPFSIWNRPAGRIKLGPYSRPAGARTSKKYFVGARLFSGSPRARCRRAPSRSRDKIASRMEAPLPERTSRVRLGRRLALAAVASALLLGAGCGEGSPGAIASRIFSRYQKVTGAKPLTAGGMIRLRLAAAGGREGIGSAEILWEPNRYRETVASAGWTTVRGIELGKAYFTDQDGVTRVVSDPVLQELTTRSYFWRRAWLFEDREDARMRLESGERRGGLGPAAALRGEPPAVDLLTARRPPALGPLPAVRPRVLLRHQVSRWIRSPSSVRRRNRLGRAPHRKDAEADGRRGPRPVHRSLLAHPVRSGRRPGRRIGPDRRRARAPGRRRHGGRAGPDRRPDRLSPPAFLQARRLRPARGGRRHAARSGASPTLRSSSRRPTISRRASTRRREAACSGRPSSSWTPGRDCSGSTIPSAGSFRRGTCAS